MNSTTHGTLTDMDKTLSEQGITSVVTRYQMYRVFGDNGVTLTIEAKLLTGPKDENDSDDGA